MDGQSGPWVPGRKYRRNCLEISDVVGHNVVPVEPGGRGDEEIHDPANPLLRSASGSPVISGRWKRLPGPELSSQLRNLSVDRKDNHHRFEHVEDPIELVQQSRIPGGFCVRAIAHFADDHGGEAKGRASGRSGDNLLVQPTIWK